MRCLLAYAVSGDQSLPDMKLILLVGSAIAAVAIVTAVPIVTAIRRRCRRGAIIMPLAVIWGIFAAGSAGVAVSGQLRWNQEENQLLMGGYYDPREQQHPPPVRPWTLWIGLGTAYCGLLLWAAVDKPFTVQYLAQTNGHVDR